MYLCFSIHLLFFLYDLLILYFMNFDFLLFIIILIFKLISFSNFPLMKSIFLTIHLIVIYEILIHFLQLIFVSLDLQFVYLLFISLDLVINTIIKNFLNLLRIILHYFNFLLFLIKILLILYPYFTNHLIIFLYDPLIPYF